MNGHIVNIVGYSILYNFTLLDTAEIVVWYYISNVFETFPPSHAAGKGMVTLYKIILSEHASVMNCTLTVN